MRPCPDPLPGDPASRRVPAFPPPVFRVRPPPLPASAARKRRPPKEEGGESCPVKPNRPLDLSGGAAAALEFDD